MEIRTLGPRQVDLEWMSTLTGTRYRYDPASGWVFLRPHDSRWYPYRPGTRTEYVWAMPGEYFSEVTGS